jgi:hypothetical protein
MRRGTKQGGMKLTPHHRTVHLRTQGVRAKMVEGVTLSELRVAASFPVFARGNRARGG